MFDKLIESDSTGADFKPRSRYFLVSSVVVGILFLSAVIFSIYAAEIGLGHDDFDLSMIVAPPPVPDVVPEPPPPRSQSQPTQAQSELPTRVVNMPRVDEIQPTPTTFSVVPNTDVARPDGRFDIGPRNIDPPSGIISGGPEGTGSDPVATEILKPEPVAPAPVPPPIKEPAPVRIKSIGVANGIATYLPKPPYPATAIALNIQGKVDVQVTIDESGKVISAKAASGHPFLRPAAEKAAWSARFTPTTLSKVPVKVTGVIVYNFTRN